MQTNKKIFYALHSYFWYFLVKATNRGLEGTLSKSLSEHLTQMSPPQLELLWLLHIKQPLFLAPHLHHLILFNFLQHTHHYLVFFIYSRSCVHFVRLSDFSHWNVTSMEEKNISVLFIVLPQCQGQCFPQSRHSINFLLKESVKEWILRILCP